MADEVERQKVEREAARAEEERQAKEAARLKAEYEAALKRAKKEWQERETALKRAGWLSFDGLVKIVLARFRISVGAAEGTVRKALASGDVRRRQAHRSADPVLLVYNDGMLDMNLRPGMSPDGRGVIPPVERPAGHYSVDDFLHWLRLNPPQTEPATTQPNSPKPGKQVKRDRARKAIKECWPDGVPDTMPLDKSFCTRLRARCKARKIAWLDNTSDKTILRAARDFGRK
jgi:hypothetical protein